MYARSGKITITTLILAALVLISAVVCTSSVMGSTRKITPHQLTILFSGDDYGNVKAPCG